MKVQTTFLIPEMDHLSYELLNTGLKNSKQSNTFLNMYTIKWVQVAELVHRNYSWLYFIDPSF